MNNVINNAVEPNKPLTLMLIINSIKTFILFISKIAFIIASFYYIINYKSYSIIINIPAGWKIGIIQSFCTSIESIGLMLMIIPLTLVVMSFFYNQSKILNILSNFLSFSGNIFTFALMASSGLLEEKFKVGIFTVYHAITYQKKLLAFKHLFDEKVNHMVQQVVDKVDYETFIQQAVDKSWMLYLDKVKLLSMDSIDAYTTKIVASLHAAYIDQLITIESNKPYFSWTSIYNVMSSHKILTTLAFMAGAYAIYWTIDRFRTLGEIVTDSANNQIKITETQKSTIETQKVTDNELRSVAERETIVSNIVQQNTKDILDLQNTTNKLSLAVNKNADILQDVVNNKYNTNAVANSKLSDTKILELFDKSSEIASESQNNILALNTKVDNVKQRVDILEAIKPNTNYNSSPTADSAERREVINLQTLANDTKADLLKLRKESKNDNQNLSIIIDNVKKDNDINAETIDKLKKEVGRQSNANNELLKRQEALTNNQESMTQTFNQSIDHIKALDTKEVILNSQLMDQETKLNNHETKLNNHELTLKHYENVILTNVENMDSKVTTLKSQVTTLQENVNMLKENHEALRHEVTTGLQSLTSHFAEFKTSFTQKLSALHPGRGILNSSFNMLQGIRADNQHISSQVSSSSTLATTTTTTTSTSSNVNIDSNTAVKTLDFTPYSALRSMALGHNTMNRSISNNNNVTTPSNIPQSASSSSDESTNGSDSESDRE